MLDHESEETRLSAEKAEVAANDQPTTNESHEIARPHDLRKSQNQALYGSAPILPFESQERYERIAEWLKPGFGGHLSCFEHYLEKEMVDSIWKRQRWDRAEAALTNRLGRQLMETAAPSTLIHFESLLSGLSVHQLLEFPAPRELSAQELAKLEAPPALRAVALVKNQPTRAVLMTRSELEGKRFNAAGDLLMELRERRGQLFAMDHWNGLAQNRVPPSAYELDAEKFTASDRRKEQLRRRKKNRIIYAERGKGWTEAGLALLGCDFLLRGESAWALADLYLAIEEYFGVEWPGDVVIAFEIAKDTWHIRRLNEAAHQILLMSFEAEARKYLAQNVTSPGRDDSAGFSSDSGGALLVRELEAAGTGPNVLLAEVLEKIAPMLERIEQEIDRAYARRLDNVRRFTRLRSRKLQTELHHIRGAGYRNRGERDN
jgi:hypothetical protein